MNAVDQILGLIQPYTSVSIIGMAKNVGKTTTLNALIHGLRQKCTLGLTSIGRDGESVDVVTATPKPRIYIKQGTIVATAEQCFLNSDITKEILLNTGISTPLGNVLIVRALSDGNVELAGPSQAKLLAQVNQTLLKFQVNKVLIDGAINRRSFASPMITQCTILATGAAVSKDLQKVVEMTVHSLRLLTWELEKSKNIIQLSLQISHVGMILSDNTVIDLGISTAIDSVQVILEHLNFDTQYLVIKGIFSDKFLQELMDQTDLYQNLTILVENGTKLFLSPEMIYKFQKTGGKLKVLHPIKVICISANPYGYGYEFNRTEFLQRLRDHISIPVFDVVGGE